MPPTADQKIRDQLKDTRAQIAAKRDEIKTKETARDEAKKAWIDSGNEVANHEAPEFQAAEAAVADVGRSKDELADLQRAENGLLGMLDEGPSPSELENIRDRVRAARWDGEALLQGEESPYKRAKAGGVFSSTNKFGSVILGEVADRDSVKEILAGGGRYAAPIGSGDLSDGLQAIDRRGIVPPLLKPLTLLDLIPTGTTDAASIEYVQITSVPTGAQETAEGALKPELGLGTADAVAPVRTIPGWVKLMRQALDDIAALGTLINTLLPYEVRRRIESQILVGDGVGQNLTGILNTSGIGAPAFVAGDNPADAILRAMTTVILSDADPNFAAVNPITWQDILLLRETGTGATRAGAYIFGTPAGIAAPTIWGLTLTTNRTVPQATPLVGDSNGATILVREGVNVRVSDSDQDDFVRNRVTVLAEARVAFPVWRPASFAVADLS